MSVPTLDTPARATRRRRNGIHFHSEYLGAATILLATLAPFRSGPRRALARFWTGTLVVGTLRSLGGHTPFYRLVYDVVPRS